MNFTLLYLNICPTEFGMKQNPIKINCTIEELMVILMRLMSILISVMKIIQVSL